MAEEAGVEVSEKDIERVRDVFRTLAVTIKTFTIYPKDNPIYQKFEAELFERFTSFFESDDQLSVDIEQYSLLYKGKSVYHSEERNDNIALLLFADGIRQIDFHKGITSEEITDFIEILRLASRFETKDDDDIVTLLWEKNIKNMGYSAVEDTVDDALAVEESLLSEGIDQKSSDAATIGANSHPGTAIKSTPFALETKTLSDNELNTIKNEFSELEEKALLSSAVRLFFELLANKKESEIFPEIIQNIGRIVDIRMKDKDIKGTIEILTDLKKISAVFDAPEQKKFIDNVIDNAGTADKLTTLFSESESGDIKQYLFLLGNNSIPHMIYLLGELQEMKQRKLLCEILAEICKQDIDALSEALTDDRWYLVRNLTMILGMTREPAAVRHLEKVLVHPNMKVKREVVKALENINSEDTKNLFLVALNDEDSTIRIRALKALKKFKDPALFRILRESASIEELRERPFEEKKELLETLAVIGGKDAFPVLSDLFRKRGLLEKNEITEIRACAAYGLGLISTPEAIALIEKETGSKKDILREACISALKESQKSGNIRR
ncbi:MAG TPA: HEAT repeat domain-containing protein [Thermodesulfovibrionales bacterium]|nr:HEAT repeat domain-containing protein [Thermodesulfovibrionales bacterium]